MNGPGWAGASRHTGNLRQAPLLFILTKSVPGSVPDVCKPAHDCKVAAKQENQGQHAPACACRLQPWLHLLLQQRAWRLPIVCDGL